MVGVRLRANDRAWVTARVRVMVKLEFRLRVLD